MEWKGREEGGGSIGGDLEGRDGRGRGEGEYRRGVRGKGREREREYRRGTRGTGRETEKRGVQRWS